MLWTKRNDWKKFNNLVSKNEDDIVTIIIVDDNPHCKYNFLHSSSTNDIT